MGDGKYGGSGQENLGHGWGAQLGGDISKKMHLHARHLRLEHPVTKAMLSFTAPLPEHMQRTWDQMQWDQEMWSLILSRVMNDLATHADIV